jgi:hypothetical protein
MSCINELLQLVVNFVAYDTNFNKITIINWSKVFIMPKHVFYNLIYAIITFNTIHETTKFFFNNW